MSESMRRKNPKRYALLEEARRLGIVGRHKMNTATLRQKIEEAKPISGTVLPQMSGVAAIRKARQEIMRDDFAVGDVIRWLADGGRNVFVYAAVKSPVGWYTTAASFNSYVPQQVDFETLIEILSRSEVTEISYATAWSSIDG